MPRPPAPKTKVAGDDRGSYTAVALNGDSARDEGLSDLLLTVDPDALPEAVSCVETTEFQLFGGFLIITNAIVIGIQTDMDDWPYWYLVEHIFLVLFLTELLIKMFAIGFYDFFFVHPDIHWNCFDFFIVGLGVFDLVMSFFGSSGTGGFATIFRIIRLLRILRLFRILKFLKQLYVLAFGLVEAVKAVFWVTILMVFVLYVCSIVLVKTVGRPPEDSANYDFLYFKFGHIFQSMLTLFILMSSPNLPDFQDEDGLLESHVGLTVFLCCFIVFGSYGIVALLTGVISESMFEKNEVRKEQLRAEHEAMRKTLGKRCEELFSGLAKKFPSSIVNDDEFTVDEVKTLAGDVHEMLQEVGCDTTFNDTVRIIEFMDVNGTNQIGISEFRDTIEKVAEGLSTMGIQEIANRVGICEKKIDDVKASVDNLAIGMAEIKKLLIMQSSNALRGG